MIVGIVGLGFVGSAMFKSFEKKGISLIGYDKYKDGGISSLESVLKCDIVFLCLPTLFNETTKEYDKSAIHEVCSGLENNNYEGLVVLIWINIFLLIFIFFKTSIDPSLPDILI